MQEADNRIHISIDSRLIRKIPAAYFDGVYAMAGQDRPSPRKLSDLFMQGDDGLPSVKNRTALFAFFGENNYEWYSFYSIKLNCNDDVFLPFKFFMRNIVESCLPNNSSIIFDGISFQGSWLRQR